VFDVTENRFWSSSWYTLAVVAFARTLSRIDRICRVIRPTSAFASLAWPVTLPSWRICRYAAGRVGAAFWNTTGIPSRPKAPESPFGSNAITTRSGLSAAIASTFGVKPERDECGARFG
jgi:hypothetical protein